MLFDPARHEPLQRLPWDEGAALRMIERIARDAEDRFSPQSHWPRHPLDDERGTREPEFQIYCGAGGVLWALHHLEAAGAVVLRRSYRDYLARLVPLNRARLAADGSGDAHAASYLIGDVSLLMLAYGLSPDTDTAARIEALIAGNLDHPARELMLGSPGTMLAALFMHQHTGEPRWAELYVRTARKLWSQLLWSPEHQCRYWTQEFAGYRFTMLDAVHGFVATAVPLILGRALLDADEWGAWQQCIVATVRNTAERDGSLANWRAYLYPLAGDTRPQKVLTQFCHGAPGFVICLADLPTGELDDLLVAGGETTWAAGPLAKGSNLCHGTGGNGYAFLKLFERTGDEQWLDRARAFAMHGIAQTTAHADHYGQMRYSLWTGDPGFALFLRDCIRGAGSFPTLQTFYPPAP